MSEDVKYRCWIMFYVDGMRTDAIATELQLPRSRVRELIQQTEDELMRL